MGRHSTPDEGDDEAVEIDSPLALLDLGEVRGRHASAEDGADDDAAGAAEDGSDEFDQALTQRIAVVDAPPPVPYAESPAPPAPPVAEPTADKASAKAAKRAQKTAEAERRAELKADQKAARKTQRGESDTKADLRMLREQPAVRAQVIGAVIASFLVYTLVLLALGSTDKYLIWLWVPIVACGVLIGLVLDLAHRRARKRDTPSG